MKNVTKQNPPAPDEFRHRIQGHKEAREAITSLMGQARRQVCVFAPYLDSYLFNNFAVASALKALATQHRSNQVRFLVERGQQALHDNIRIIELCRRLSGFVKLRKVCDMHVGIREMFVIADDACYILQQDLDKPLWMVNTNARSETILLTRRFNNMWQHALSLPEINTVGL